MLHTQQLEVLISPVEPPRTPRAGSCPLLTEWRAIPHVDHGAHSLIPERDWKSFGVEEGNGTFDNGAVGSLCYPTLLGRVRGSGLVFHAEQAQVILELLAGVLSSIV
jgi:hypothetical protein